ncbi:hypothetical protein ACQ5SO_10185 [Rhodovulum sp. DZ06]|uniref:hypothetical protein n=1 Tax=Rhodovulum sp. DZ06 TaxID=3425126 RepID=UPI003D342024
MTALSASARALRGGFVVMDAEGKAALRTIPFQFNPELLTRTVTPRGAASGGGDGLEAARLTGPAAESWSFEIELDALHAPQVPGGPVLAPGQEGVAADLAALETLLSPAVADIEAGIEQARLGALEILPAPSPLAILVLGPGRVMPVRITAMTVTEEAFDIALSPIRATAALSVEVLTTEDLPWGSGPAGLYLAALARREKRAGTRARGLSAVGLTSI